MSYMIEKSRFYKEGERYNAGEGISFFEADETKARAQFESYAADHRTADREYSVTLTNLATGEVLRHIGPSKRDTERAMLRAYRERIAA